MKRQFTVRGPDRLWVMDVTEHRTDEGKVYVAVVAVVAVVVDAWSRRVVGWSIADHMRSELVVDAIQMAIWRRRPPTGQCVAHSDHGSQYTSWAFGTRLRAAGLLGSMGTIGNAYDNSMAESLFHTLQLELLDEHHWTTRRELAAAIFEWIECWYNGLPPPLLHRHAQSHRLRDPHHRRKRGMITTTNPSAVPGEAQPPGDALAGRCLV